MASIKIFETREEAFDYWLEHKAEADEYEAGLAAKDIIKEWLRDADNEIIGLKEELKDGKYRSR